MGELAGRACDLCECRALLLRALTRRAILFACAHSLTYRCGLRTTWITFARPPALGMPPRHGTCRAASSLAPLPSKLRSWDIILAVPGDRSRCQTGKRCNTTQLPAAPLTLEVADCCCISFRAQRLSERASEIEARSRPPRLKRDR
jgi:hypothetical protein